jgi:hypothetical protein
MIEELDCWRGGVIPAAAVNSFKARTAAAE